MALRRAARTIAILLLLTGPAALVACDASEPRPSRPPNLLFVLVDALRADHLSLYGYERKTSPNLEALATSGWTFDAHLSHAGQTVPSTVSLMVSQLPAEHGYRHSPERPFRKVPPRYRDDLVFLAEVFQAAGYQTAGFVANPFLGRKNGFDQGFDHFVLRRDSERKLRSRAVTWLRRNGTAGGRPFFAYVHTMAVHSPYQPPPRYRDLYATPSGGRLRYRNGKLPDLSPADLAFTVARYDEQIHQADDLLRELLGVLDENGVREETIVVFSSDHGDEFMEHGGLGHGTSVYGELVRVPLVVSYPAGLPAGRRVAHRTQHLDLAPSLLALAGLEPPPSFRGRSGFPSADRVFAEDGPWYGVYADDTKLVLDARSGESTLYRADDHLDLEPLEDPARTRALAELLAGYRSAHLDAPPPTEGAAPTWTEEEAKQLEALGYVE